MIWQIGILIFFCTLSFGIIYILLNFEKFKKQQHHYFSREEREPIIVNVNNTLPTGFQIPNQNIINEQKNEKTEEQQTVEAETKMTRILSPTFNKKIKTNFKTLGEHKSVSHDINNSVNALKNTGENND